MILVPVVASWSRFYDCLWVWVLGCCVLVLECYNLGWVCGAGCDWRFGFVKYVVLGFLEALMGRRFDGSFGFTVFWLP